MRANGIKIEWEMPPGGELMVEEGIIPGRRSISLVGSDAVVHDPRGRWSSVVIRLLGMGLILDGTKNYAPVAALHTPQGAPDQYPVVKLDDNTWTVTMDRVTSPAHEAGFSPDGERYCMMNNLRQHSMVVFDTAAPDPREWKKDRIRGGPKVARHQCQPVPPGILRRWHEGLLLVVASGTGR